VQIKFPTANLEVFNKILAPISEPFIAKDGFEPTFKNPLQIQKIGTLGELIIRFNYKVIVPNFVVNSTNTTFITSRKLNDD
jgi:hypothetical protein